MTSPVVPLLYGNSSVSFGAGVVGLMILVVLVAGVLVLLGISLLHGWLVSAMARSTAEAEAEEGRGGIPSCTPAPLHPTPATAEYNGAHGLQRAVQPPCNPATLPAPAPQPQPAPTPDPLPPPLLDSPVVPVDPVRAEGSPTGGSFPSGPAGVPIRRYPGEWIATPGPGGKVSPWSGWIEASGRPVDLARLAELHPIIPRYWLN